MLGWTRPRTPHVGRGRIPGHPMLDLGASPPNPTLGWRRLRTPHVGPRCVHAQPHVGPGRVHAQPHVGPGRVPGQPHGGS